MLTLDADEKTSLDISHEHAAARSALAGRGEPWERGRAERRGRSCEEGVVRGEGRS